MNQHILTGQVDVTSNLLVGSSHLFVDTTNNRVGLVTNDPHAGLHVNSNAYVNTDLRVGSQIEINTTPGRVKAVSFEGDGSLLVNAPVGSLAVHSTDTGLPGTDAIVTNEGTPTAAEFKFVIPRGDVGATGTAATVAVGTTTTGVPGTNASVTNSGSSSAAVFDFTVPKGDQGIQGIQGIQGETGTAATVAVGTTTTGVPGTNASVTNTGSSSAASFDFTIPRGDTGATGPAGTVAIGTTTTGAAGSSASVTNTGTSTAANLEFTIPKGDQGIQGVQGPAATIAVGTTTTSAPGTNGSVTNSGSSSAAVFDFIVPRGADGTNYFTLSGSNIYRSTGNVGIGVTDPDSKLEVRGNIRASISDTNHGMFIDAGGTILRDYGGNGAGLHFTANQIFPTNYLGSYSAGGIDLGSSSYRWNNVYTEALNASGTIDSTGIITCNANKMVITGSSPTLYLRDSDQRTGMIHQNDNRMYFLSGAANSDSWAQTANNRWPLYLQMDTNEAVFGGNIDAAVGTVTASTFSATSQVYLGTSASIRQSSTPGWTGDPGSGVGKIEYHSNRWYVVAGSNSSELIRVRRDGSDKFVIDNDGSISLGTVPAARISGTVGTATNQSGGTVSCTSGSFSGQFSASTASSRDKFRVYPTSQYCIGMQSGVTFGDLNDWSMTFQMNNEDDRGFWWGDDGHGVNQGAMALSTRGWLNVAERIKVGGGQTDTGAAGWNLQVQGNAYISSTLEADGRIYADNGCHVRGDWLRVNGQAGIYFESYGGGWSMEDSTWIKAYNSKGLYVNNQIRMASLRALGGDFASRLDWPNSGHHVDCYHNSSGHVFHINYYAQQSVYLNRTAYSDRRIKEDIKDIDDVSALNVLRKIKPKTYKYKLQPHKGTVYGFIAQDVREVLPYATNLTKLSAPFDREKFVNATILENGVVNLDKPCNELKIGKNAYFYYESSTSTRDFEVTEITSPTQFRVRIDEGGSEWIGNTILVGKEVDDFHGIDKDAIFTVATAALQEVDRQLQAEKVKTKNLEALVLSLITRVQKLEAR